VTHASFSQLSAYILNLQGTLLIVLKRLCWRKDSVGGLNDFVRHIPHIAARYRD
jgi:hypothetical protein